MELEDLDSITLSSLFDLDEIQKLQDQFCRAVGISSVIAQLDGTPITRTCGINHFCDDFIRSNEKGCARCFQSDAVLGRLALEKPAIRRCSGPGLWDGAAVITVRDKPIAIWLLGPVRDHNQKEGDIRNYLRSIGADEEEGIKAFRKVPTMDQTKFQSMVDMLSFLANLLSTIAYQNYRQKKHIAEDEVLLEKQQKTETYLNTLIDTVPDLLWFKDPEGRYLYCNARFENFYGDEKENIIGKTDYDFMSLETADSFRQFDRNAINAGHSIKFEEEVVYNSDHHREVLETIKTPILHESGEIMGVLGIGRDITERIESERELMKTQEWLQSFLESTNDAITIYDKTGNIVQINSCARAMYPKQFEGREIIGTNIRDYAAYYPREGVTLLHYYDLVRETGRTYTFEEEYLSEDASIPYSHKIFPVGEGIGIISNDISKQKKLENQLRQIQKIESIGRLAGGVAHDFNNILGIIMGYAEMALGSTDKDEAHDSYLQEIIKAAERSSSLTKQLLAFARKQNVSPETLDLNRRVENMLKMLGSLIGEDIELNWQAGRDLWPVCIDPAQVDQVIANLCVNARDAIGGTGRIIIETANQILDETYCDYHPETIPGEYVCLSVSDNGMGMAEEVMTKIFEPFYTTKGVGKGTGLGLSTVYGIVKQNNGSITVYSELGMGTTFKVYFQRDMKTSAQGEKKKESEADRGNEKILIIEDEAVLLKMSSMMLSNYGYRVFTAGTKEEALAIVAAEEIDLVLSDIVMPETNGKELADLIRKDHGDIKYLFMSGYTDDIIARHGILEEGIQFIQKPFSSRELADAVRDVLDFG
ncbi:MAG: PocR ligand-binding domain-containing protein [Spirochaetales bacterium]|nr:PocR ligand-binding domain-containing protein [Spirochaetales bacterium]